MFGFNSYQEVLLSEITVDTKVSDAVYGPGEFAISKLVAGVHVVNICLLTVAFETAGLCERFAGFEVTSALLKAWAKVHNAAYYAAPREDFSEWVAVGQALQSGRDIVVVEDLS